MTPHTKRYRVARIADDHGRALNPETDAWTDTIEDARRAAEGIVAPYGAGIEDTATGQIDVGFGFGVPIPTEND